MGTPFSFVRRGEIETANRVGVDEGGNKRKGKRDERWVESKWEKNLGKGSENRERRERREKEIQRQGQGGNLRGGSEMKGRNEKEERNDAERESGLRGRDSIKRTHINESFQGKTELYVGAGMSVHTVCEHVRIQTNIVEGSQLQAQLHRGDCIYNEYPDRTFPWWTLASKDSFG